MRKEIKILSNLKILLIVPFVSTIISCATQAQLVDLEKSVNRIAHKQEALSGDLNLVIRKIQTSLNEKREGDVKDEQLLGIRSKLDSLEADVIKNLGLWEENSNFISEVALKIDDINDSLSEFNSRLQAVEIGLTSLDEEVRTFYDSKDLLKKNGISEQQGEAESSKQQIESSVFQEGEEVLQREPGEPEDGLSKENNLSSGSMSGVTSGMTSIEAYNLAYRDFVRGNYTLAIKGFESFNKHFPSSTLAHQAQYWIGDSYFEMKEFQSSISAFEKLIALYPDSDKVVTALLKESYALAEIGDNVKSEEYLKQIIERFPYAKEAKLAKEKLSEIR